MPDSPSQLEQHIAAGLVTQAKAKKKPVDASDRPMASGLTELLIAQRR